MAKGEHAHAPCQPGFVDRLPRVFLRTESCAVAIAAIIAFSRTGQSWWLFAGLILAPDLSILGYGLKHAESFGATHLGAIGRSRAPAMRGS